LEDHAKQSELNKTDVLDRVRGAILAAACANSLGASCVGVNYKEIIASVGISGSMLRDFSKGLPKSAMPDHRQGDLGADSYLAMTFADSLIASKGRFDAEDLRKRYRVLLEEEYFLKGAPGATCLAGLRRMADKEAPGDEPSEALHANAAARAFPAGCLPGGSKSDDPVTVSAAQAALSNGDKRAQSAAAVVADSVHYFIMGGRMDAENEVRAYVRREFEVANRFDPRFAESWDDVAPDLDYINPAEDLPYSLVNVESNLNELVPTAVGIFLVFRHNLEEAICAAARSGGDTDTVATIVGALSGAYHGASKIPQRWLEGLANKEQLEKIAESLGSLW
jgi:ADP-ribosylglycohydrolase